MDPRELPATWPFRLQARRLRAGPHDWWVAELGSPDAPAVLMLHGLGASGHSFRRTAPGLAQHFRLIIPDLPGQGCTRCGAVDRLSLNRIAEDLWMLCESLGAAPRAILGHSAGAAIALQMALLRPVPRVVGLNAAVGAFEGPAGLLFPVLARGLAALPFVPRTVSTLMGSEARVRDLLDGTGSKVDDETVALYVRLVRDPDHVAGALGMMARWNLDPLLARLPGLSSDVVLIAARDDRTVPPRVSHAVATRLVRGRVIDVEGGHIVHEERADGLAGLLLEALQFSSDSPKIN
ncbi:alpha/beta fold hydrolase BchO [Neotabrizicola shimadae]|uniref:Alpha/beta fold hydrolase n=1 Tax=Neotabrizicola shimadae TaxID=2807096 RepID=A0A8G1EDD6_9RHOB|nr:alpha/beta fold hydrolase BchO [Neotabrizicola shimadae]QYZ69299.1 alpha/beta fold hydrolase [Neotabrizicola shimadae]